MRVSETEIVHEEDTADADGSLVTLIVRDNTIEQWQGPFPTSDVDNLEFSNLDDFDNDGLTDVAVGSITTVFWDSSGFGFDTNGPNFYARQQKDGSFRYDDEIALDLFKEQCSHLTGEDLFGKFICARGLGYDVSKQYKEFETRCNQFLSKQNPDTLDELTSNAHECEPDHMGAIKEAAFAPLPHIYPKQPPYDGFTWPQILSKKKE